MSKRNHSCRGTQLQFPFEPDPPVFANGDNWHQTMVRFARRFQGIESGQSRDTEGSA